MPSSSCEGVGGEQACKRESFGKAIIVAGGMLRPTRTAEKYATFMNYARGDRIGRVSLVTFFAKGAYKSTWRGVISSRKGKVEKSGSEKWTRPQGRNCSPYSFPSSKSTIQHPRTCGPSLRQWLRMSALSHPASSNASARTARRTGSSTPVGWPHCRIEPGSLSQAVRRAGTKSPKSRVRLA